MRRKKDVVTFCNRYVKNSSVGRMAILIGVFIELKNSNQTNARTNTTKEHYRGRIPSVRQVLSFRGFSQSCAPNCHLILNGQLWPSIQPGEALVSPPANVSLSVHSKLPTTGRSSYARIRSGIPFNRRSVGFGITAASPGTDRLFILSCCGGRPWLLCGCKVCIILFEPTRPMSRSALTRTHLLLEAGRVRRPSKALHSQQF
jgi:hypothetical protein